MRRRIIDPLFWLNGEISKISDKAKLLYIGLWTISDDYGTLENDPLKIRAQVFPYNHNLKIEKYLEELLKIGKIVSYEAEGKKYFYIKNFLKYQWLSHPSSDYPKSPVITGEIQKLLAKRKERKGKEIEIEKKEPSFKIYKNELRPLKEIAEEKYKKGQP